jgi:hypothetical protein
MRAAASKLVACATAAIVSCTLAFLSGAGGSELPQKILSRKNIAAYLLSNIPPVFSTANPADAKPLPLLLKGFSTYAMLGTLPNEAHGYISTYLNFFINITQVGFRLNQQSAKIVFFVEDDWSKHVEEHRQQITNVVDFPIDYDDLVRRVGPGSLCQSFIYSKNGTTIDAAVIFLSSPLRTYEFDRCSYRMILQMFGFKSGLNPPDKVLRDDEPGDRLLDMASLMILYSLPEPDRTVAKLRGAVDRLVQNPGSR